MTKRILSVLLAFVLLFGLLPVQSVSAADNTKTVIEIPFSAKIPYEHYNKKYGCKYSHKCRHLYSEVKCTQKPTYKYYIYNNKYNFKQLIFYIFF